MTDYSKSSLPLKKILYITKVWLISELNQVIGEHNSFNFYFICKGNPNMYGSRSTASTVQCTCGGVRKFLFDRSEQVK